MVPTSPGCALPVILALLLGVAGFLGFTTIQESAVFPEPPAVVVTAVVPQTPLVPPTPVLSTLAAPTVVPPTRLPPSPLVPPTRLPSGTPDPATGSTGLTILNVLNPGDVTGEAVELYNLGDAVNLRGWQIVAPDGEVFIFPDFILFSGGLIRVYTRAGDNTPVALYWGRASAAWATGEPVLLLDPAGQTQVVFVVGGES